MLAWRVMTWICVAPTLILRRAFSKWYTINLPKMPTPPPPLRRARQAKKFVILSQWKTWMCAPPPQFLENRNVSVNSSHSWISKEQSAKLDKSQRVNDLEHKEHRISIFLWTIYTRFNNCFKLVILILVILGFPKSSQQSWTKVKG